MSTKIYLVISLMISSLLAPQVDGQFFTKSSKSIPRMGRRSVEGSPKSALATYRHLLIDSLVDRFGPDLINELEQAKKIEEIRSGGNELSYKVDQPFDLNNMDQSAMMMREERAPARNKDSLAMRALNTNRYIQHLASGQPLISYDSLFGGQQPLQRGGDQQGKQQSRKIFNDK